MEALTLPRKSNTISKGKLKKNIKNVICRPDQVFWPEITADQGKIIKLALKQYRIDIPEFKKPHWKELKLIPKENRPKPPKLKKIDGLLFGITECRTALQDAICSAVIIEATVNPRMIVHPILELCSNKKIPLLCMTDLRRLTLLLFGVKTSCLGVKIECLPDLRTKILDISKLYPMPVLKRPVQNIEKLDRESESELTKSETEVMDTSKLPYLYRTNRKTRVFIPRAESKHNKTANKFIGQDFIEFADKIKNDKSKSYMKMIVKRISNNSDRAKKK